MIDKIIEELEYHKLGWENTDEYNLQRRPFIETYSKAIEIVERHQNLTFYEQVALLPNDLSELNREKGNE